MPYLGKEPARVPVTAADIPDDSITAAKILDGVITAADIAAGAVDTAELAADAVEGSKIADNAIGSEHIASGSVDNAHLATGIDAAKLTTGTIPIARIADDAVTNAKMADDAIDSAQIASGAVDDAHIVGLTSSKLSGNLPALNASSLTSVPAGNLTGSLPAIDGSALTGVATDLTSIRNDIATLALNSAISDNKAAFNLPNSFIDQFEDDSGIGSETDGDRHASEYWSTVVAGDANTLLLCHFDGDFSDETGTHTITAAGSGAVVSTTEKKFGTHSLKCNGTGYLTMSDHADFDWGAGNFTIESWAKNDVGTFSSYQTPIWSQSQGGNPGSNNNIWVQLYHTAGGIYVHEDDGSGERSVSGTWSSLGTGWHHYCIQKHDTNNLSFYIDGVREATASHSEYTNLGGGSSLNATIGARYGGGEIWDGYIDEVRISNTLRYTTAGFTPPSSALSNPSSTSATGTLISTAQTANASQTKVSGVILYKNASGTATLGTDLKIYFTCNGGTNWTESTPVAAGTFSAGILMAKCPEVTCTAGTDIRYKAVWANQAAGSKVTELHGIGMNY